MKLTKTNSATSINVPAKEGTTPPSSSPTSARKASEPSLTNSGKLAVPSDPQQTKRAISSIVASVPSPAPSTPDTASSSSSSSSANSSASSSSSSSSSSFRREAALTDPDLAPYREHLRTKGHLFIVNGDLRKVACDAWLVPCSSRFQFDSRWLPVHEKFPPELAVELTRKSFFDLEEPLPSGARPPLALRVTPWHSDFAQPYLVNVTGIKSPISENANFLDLSSTMEAVTEFLKLVASEFRDVPPKRRREKHLICMPLVGTGHGGARNVMGLVIKELLPVVFRFVHNNNFDLALVTNEPTAYAALQSERKRWEASAWLALEPPLRAEAKRLAKFARHEQLVLFIGAGVSMGAGLPSWGSLLTDLASQAGISQAEIKGSTGGEEEKKEETEESCLD